MSPNPYHVTTLFNEETSVEKEVLQHLISPALGWRYLPRDEVTKQYRADASGRIDEREVLLLPILREKLKKLNAGVITDDARANMIIQKLRAERSNQQWLLWLRNEKTYQFAPDEQYKTIKLVEYDSEKLDENDFLATNQFSIDGVAPCRPDIILFLNGLPVVNIEAKTASRKKPDWAEGAKQTGRYVTEIEQLYYSNAYCVGVNETRMKYGVPGERLQYWLQWQDPWPHQIDEFDEMKVSLYGLFDHRNMLDLIRYFILHVTEDGKTIKKVARYQQYRAANKLAARAVEVVRKSQWRRGLVWHTQGSGKTLTMIFAARKLWEAGELTQPTIVILVDREQLEDQMTAELFATQTENWTVAGTIRELADLLSGDHRGVILTTIHKFDGMVADICRGRANIIVMADEAHRTQEGDYGTYMRAALPKASMFGFSGTPIENDDHNTPNAWGQLKDDGTLERYMDFYPVEKALKDKVVIPIHYLPRLTDWQLWGAKLDLAFNRVFAHLSEAERAKLASQEAKLDALIKHPQRIAQIAADVATHFKEHVRPNGFKAMLVCKDKETCVLYKEALDQFLEPDASLIVYSEDPRGDSESVRRYHLGAAKRKQVINQFEFPVAAEPDLLKPYRKIELFIVCDMLLTGFDAPICQTMYLDKGLKNHSLLQAIARVNRPYNELKAHGLILDYYGVFDNLNEALNYRPEELGDVAFPFDKIRTLFKQQFDEVWNMFESIPKDGSHDSFIKAMKLLVDTEGLQDRFEKGYRNLRVMYEALQPDEFLRDYIRPYTWLTKLYILYLKKFYPAKYMEVTEEDAARTRELIRDHIDVNEIERDFPTYVLDENYLTKMKKKDPDTKALDIEATLTAELRIRLDHDETFRPLSEQLQRLIDEKRAGALAGIMLIEELEKLTAAVVAAIEESKRPISQSLALAVKERVPGISDAKAVEIASAILTVADSICFPGWWDQRSDVETQLTREITLMLADRYRELTLIGAGKDFVSVCIRLLKRKRYVGSS